MRFQPFNPKNARRAQGYFYNRLERSQTPPEPPCVSRSIPLMVFNVATRVVAGCTLMPYTSDRFVQINWIPTSIHLIWSITSLETSTTNGTDYRLVTPCTRWNDELDETRILRAMLAIMFVLLTITMLLAVKHADRVTLNRRLAASKHQYLGTDSTIDQVPINE